MSNIHKNFNSRTRVGATRHILHRQARYQFQFTHPCGCDWGLAAMDGNPSGFNSRTRVGATSPMRAFGGTRMFQFTHPCGCDQALTLITKLIRVPIHAPVWVRRPCRPRPGAPGQVSIHAPVWVRPARKMDDVLFGLFQFTHPCGCDAGPPKAGDSIYRVSIHAPVWVRPSMPYRDASGDAFQFTHPCGCDGILCGQFGG